MQKIHPDILKWVIIALAGFAAVVLIFGAGMIAGGMKARFSYHWAESYHKNFAGPRGGFIGEWRRPPLPGDFIEGRGVFGEIITLEASSTGQTSGFVIKSQGDVEKIIMVTEDTMVKKGGESVKNGLKVGEQVVIIGSPNNEGQIEAKLIRVFDGELNGPPMPYRRPPGFPFI